MLRELDRKRLEKLLGHSFLSPKLLDEALTHSSNKSGKGKSYERLEFLGDRVLGLLVAELLYKRFPKESEGALGKRFAALVSREALSEVAGKLTIAPFITLSASETERGGQDNPSIQADVMEALIAALFLDAGLDYARRFVEKNWQELLSQDREPPQDAKTRLQEWAQARGLGLPSYQVTMQSGPSHDPDFRMKVEIAKIGAAEGHGKTKRLAEQQAAAALLRQLLEKDT